MPSPREVPVYEVKSGRRKTLMEALEGRKSLVEFWSPSTENGPRTLDDLQIISGSMRFADYQFVSVCCSTLPEFTELLEKNESSSRWSRLSMLLVWEEDQATVKEAFGISHYPHYVVLSTDGSFIVSSKVLDLSALP